MPNALVVLAHPEPKSMNHALATVACDTLACTGYTVAFSDLYAMDFDPRSSRASFLSRVDPDFFKPQAEERHASSTGGFVSDLDAEIRKLEACDVMILQFPLWWFSLPAVLKGWVDRVFVSGRIYGGSKMFEGGVKRGKRAMLSLTTGGGPSAYEPGGVLGDLGSMLKPIHRGILKFVGFDVLAPNVVYGPARMTDDERRAALAAWRTRLLSLETERPVDVGGF
jgi:NAD(P)H dehydrogenase (quinone)